IIYPMTLFSSALFIGYPLWLYSWKQTSAFAILWNITMFLVLICFSFLMVLIGGFAEVQLMAFMVNILLICSLIRWRWALFNILAGTFFMTFCYNNFILIGPQQKSEMNVVYLLLLVSSILVLFLRPREVKQELAEEKLEHLEDRIDFQNEEIEKLTDLKYEFLRNLQHEAKTPIAGIANLSEALWFEYDKMPERDRKKLVKMIASSGERLKSLIFNFIDLSHLLTLKFDLKKKKCDIGKLLQERLEVCSKLYIDDAVSDKYKFDVNISEGIFINCDSYYIGRALDNLIINAIKYSDGGVIRVSLTSSDDCFEFSIEDEGIGVPPSELSKIFAAMVVSSRTHTSAGGRGVGLALCRKVIELHEGKIWAESTKTGKGVIFKFTIPKKV
ncbi:MAG: HAMP domain-containing histidine kinase, partial [Rickettsiaceae bacterium]|nr:HAMP domain-containing histidine kinase [Rickettsiaceae bacterium]